MPLMLHVDKMLLDPDNRLITSIIISYVGKWTLL